MRKATNARGCAGLRRRADSGTLIMGGWERAAANAAGANGANGATGATGAGGVTGANGANSANGTAGAGGADGERTRRPVGTRTGNGCGGERERGEKSGSTSHDGDPSGIPCGTDQQPAVLSDGAADHGRDPRQRLDGRAQRDRHVRFHARDAAAGGHPHGGGAELPGRARHDAAQRARGGHDLRHGEF